MLGLISLSSSAEKCLATALTPFSLEYFPILIFISSSNFMYEPRFFTPMPLGMACCKLFTAALAAAIAGDDRSHDKGPVGLGRARGALLEYLKIDILTVERERES